MISKCTRITMVIVARRGVSNVTLGLHAYYYSIHITFRANYVYQVCQNHNVDSCATWCVKFGAVSACVPLLITNNTDS